MPAFDLMVVGSGGGPSEVNLSGYLLKAHDTSWTDGIVGIEAGSGLGALSRILREKPQLLTSSGEPGLSAAKIYANVRTYLITHAHLDHVLSLVLMAGSVSGPRKSIRGSRECLEDLQTIFAPSRIWPNLASWDPNDSNHLYLYDPLPDDPTLYTPVLGSLSVRMLPLSHGTGYTSAAYFLRYDPALRPSCDSAAPDTNATDADAGAREFLFLGDVMPDAIADRPLTAAVWRAAAPKIPHKLATLFVECSWPSGRADTSLYGHLTPEHLVCELENLAAAVVDARESPQAPTSRYPESEFNRTAAADGGPVLTSKRRASTAAATSDPKRHKRALSLDDLRGALTGLRVYVIHCKEDMEGKYDRPTGEIITEQVARLAAEKDLGVEVLEAVQGTIIQI